MQDGKARAAARSGRHWCSDRTWVSGATMNCTKMRARRCWRLERRESQVGSRRGLVPDPASHFCDSERLDVAGNGTVTQRGTHRRKETLEGDQVLYQLLLIRKRPLLAMWPANSGGERKRLPPRV